MATTVAVARASTTRSAQLGAAKPQPWGGRRRGEDKEAAAPDVWRARGRVEARMVKRRLGRGRAAWRAHQSSLTAKEARPRPVT